MTQPPQASRHQRTLILAHPDRLMRESIAKILLGSDFRLLGQASTLRDLRQIAKAQAPDITLLAGNLPDGDLVSIEGLCNELESSSIVLLTDPKGLLNVIKGIRAGVRGYLSVNLAPEEFLRSLHLISEGDVIISKELAVGLDGAMEFEGQDSVRSLSERELEVLALIGLGATNKEIAEKLIITQNTVKVHLRNILDKLDLRNRHQAAAFAAQEGLVE